MPSSVDKLSTCSGDTNATIRPETAVKNIQNRHPAQTLHFELTYIADLDLENLSNDWQQLTTRALELNPFYSPMMLTQAFRKLVRPGQEFALLQVWHKKKLVAIFVLENHPWGNKFAPMWSQWIHDYCFCNSPLIDSDYLVVVFENLFLWLKSNSSKFAFLFPGINSEGPINNSLFAALNNTKHLYKIFNSSERAILRSDLSAEDYLQQNINSKRRKEYRRQRKRLGELGELAFVAITSDDNPQAWCDEFFELEANGWKGERGTAIACDQNHEDYIRAVLDKSHTQNELVFWRLSLDDGPLAMAFGSRIGGTVWLSKITFDEKYAKFSPGVLLVLEITRSLIDSKTVQLLDSCAHPDHPMINHIWRERMGEHDVLLSATSYPFIFNLIVLFEKYRRKLREVVKKAYYRLRGIDT